MSRFKILSFVGPLLPVLVLPLLAGCEEEVHLAREFEGTFDEVVIFVGDDVPLNVRAARAGRVSVDFRASYPDDESKDYNAFDDTMGTLLVFGQCEEDCVGFTGALDVTMPPGIALVVHAGNDTVDVEGLEGDVTVTTTSGKTVLRNLKGRIAVTSGRGNIKIKNAEGNVTTASIGGDITLENIAAFVPPDESDPLSSEDREELLAYLPEPTAQIGAQTGAGDVRADNIFGNLRLGSLSGDVTARRTTGRIEVSVDNGDVDLIDTVGNLYIYVSEEGDIRGEDVDCDVCFSETAQGTVDLSD